MSGEYSNVPPGDLHPSPEIRFVLVEIGKLTATVGRLVDDVKGQGSKLDGLSRQVDGIKRQISFVKGAVWASSAFLTLLVGVVSFFLSSKWNALETAVRAALPH